MIRSIFLWFKHLVYAVLILATLGGLAEVGLRVYDSATGQITRRGQYDRGLVCKSWFAYQTLKPAHNFAVKNPDSGERVTIAINGSGLRGPEAAIPKPPKAFRIVCLGDERTLAAQLPEEQTFCRLLQQELEGQASTSIEVINAGVPGYCPLLSCLQLRHQLLALAPDLVIENFDMSDVADDYQLRKRTVMDASGAPLCCAHPDLEIPAGFSPTRPCDMFLLPTWGRRQLGKLWAEKMLSEQQRNISSLDGKYLWLEDHPPDWSVHTQQALAPIGCMQDQLAAHSATLIVGLAPAPWQVSGTAASGAREKSGVPAGAVFTSMQPFEAIRSFCAKRNLSCCDAAAAFKRHSQPDVLYLKNAAALSREGHALYAREVADFVIDNVRGPWNRPASSPTAAELLPQADRRAP